MPETDGSRFRALLDDDKISFSSILDDDAAVESAGTVRCLVTGTATLLRPVMTIMMEMLKESRSHEKAYPILKDTCIDVFDKKMYCKRRIKSNKYGLWRYSWFMCFEMQCFFKYVTILVKTECEPVLWFKFSQELLVVILS